MSNLSPFFELTKIRDLKSNSFSITTNVNRVLKFLDNAKDIETFTSEEDAIGFSPDSLRIGLNKLDEQHGTIQATNFMAYFCFYLNEDFDENLNKNSTFYDISKDIATLINNLTDELLTNSAEYDKAVKVITTLEVDNEIKYYFLNIKILYELCKIIIAKRDSLTNEDHLMPIEENFVDLYEKILVSDDEGTIEILTIKNGVPCQTTLSFEIGTNVDALRITALQNAFNLYIDSLKMSFSADGLKLLGSSLSIYKDIYGDDDPVFYADEEGNLHLSGTLDAANGYFSGELRAATGDFSGTITAAAGNIGGFIIGEHSISSEDNSLILTSSYNDEPSKIEVENIDIGTGANIKEYLQLGNLKLWNPNNENSKNKVIDLSKEDVVNIYSDELEQGGINASENGLGENLTSNTRIRTKFLPVDNTLEYNINLNISSEGLIFANIWQYTNEKEYIARYSTAIFSKDNDTYVKKINAFDSNCKFIRIVLFKQIKNENNEYYTPAYNSTNPNEYFLVKEINSFKLSGGLHYFTLTNEGYLEGNNWSIKKERGHEYVVARFGKIIVEDGEFNGIIHAVDGVFSGSITASIINATTLNTVNFVTEKVRAMGGAFIFKPTAEVKEVTAFNKEIKNLLKGTLDKTKKLTENGWFISSGKEELITEEDDVTIDGVSNCIKISANCLEEETNVSIYQNLWDKVKSNMILSDFADTNFVLSCDFYLEDFEGRTGDTYNEKGRMCFAVVHHYDSETSISKSSWIGGKDLYLTNTSSSSLTPEIGKWYHLNFDFNVPADKYDIQSGERPNRFNFIILLRFCNATFYIKNLNFKYKETGDSSKTPEELWGPAPEDLGYQTDNDITNSNLALITYNNENNFNEYLNSYGNNPILSFSNESIRFGKYIVSTLKDLFIARLEQNDLNSLIKKCYSVMIFGLPNEHEIIAINSDDTKAGNILPERALVMEKFSNLKNNNNTSQLEYTINLLLGDLSNLGNIDDKLKTINGFGLYADNVFLNGSLTTRSTSDGTYAGVNTLKLLTFDAEEWNPSNNSLTGTEYVVFWGGANSLDDDGILSAPFIVTDKGSIYASRGEFRGAVISDSLLTRSVVKTPILYGTGDNPSLKIYDTGNGGIAFYKVQGDLDAEHPTETNDIKTMTIDNSGFYHYYGSEVDFSKRIEKGTLGAEDGLDSESNYRLRLKNYCTVAANYTYIIDSNFNYFLVHYYKSDYSHINLSGWLDNKTTFTTPENTKYIRFILCNEKTDLTTPLTLEKDFKHCYLTNERIKKQFIEFWEKDDNSTEDSSAIRFFGDEFLAGNTSFSNTEIKHLFNGLTPATIYLRGKSENEVEGSIKLIYGSTNNNKYKTDVELGSLSSSDGSKIISNYRLRSKDVIDVEEGSRYSISSNFKYFLIHYYDSLGTDITVSKTGGTYWLENETSFIIPVDTKTIKFILCNERTNPTELLTLSDFEYCQLMKDGHSVIVSSNEVRNGGGLVVNEGETKFEYNNSKNLKYAYNNGYYCLYVNSK